LIWSSVIDAPPWIVSVEMPEMARGQQLRQHRLGRARLADQHQPAAGGQRDEHALDAGHGRDDLGRDAERRVAEDERCARLSC
jgi:hypothetical protein